MALSKAIPLKFKINKYSSETDYLGFYFPGNNTDWDNVYGVPYFGNFWVIDEKFEIELDGIRAQFYTAEAAYQASKWWDKPVIRAKFESKRTGDEAFRLSRCITEPETGNYGGYGSGERVMFEILKFKFSDTQPLLKAALGSTGHAYLLEHGAKLKHQDMIWSDGNDGNGLNHLGISLMNVREHFFPGHGNPLENKNSKHVIMACTIALRTEMAKLGLSSDSRHPTKPKIDLGAKVGI